MNAVGKLLLRAAFLSAIVWSTPTLAEALTLNASSSGFYVVDGDSVNYGKLRFRLCGIQAPERDKPGYDESTAMLKSFLGTKLITAHVVDIDKYSRAVVVLYETGGTQSANERMVFKGGAKHYKRFSKNCTKFIPRKTFFAAEKEAKKKKLGIWK